MFEFSNDKVDWYIHYVPGVGDYDDMINIHTHGMENYDHLNFQIVLPIDGKQASELLNTLCIEVYNGKRFDVGTYDRSIFTCSFKLISRKETNREVLRVLFPDTKMRFPYDMECEEPFASQLRVGFMEY